MMQEALKRTPLYDEHLTLNARMVPFGGWEMPVQYEGILAEYDHTRKAVSLFDTSHMGEFMVEGDCQKTGFDHIVTMALVPMPLNTCRYGFILNEQGGVIDDLIVFRLAQNKWFVVVNGATTLKDAQHFRENLYAEVLFKDISSQTGKLDIQGPLSRDILSQYVDGIQKLNYYTFDFFELLGEEVLISRTGYTGELGYEIYYPWDKIKKLWKELLKNDIVKPAGLGARDLLRLEMGYSLYGHELDERITPLEAGLQRFLDFEKDFIGRKILWEQKQGGPARKLIGFISDSRRSPRQNHEIFSKIAEKIGVVTSGTFSPNLKRGIGLGFVSSDHTTQGEKIFFGNEKNRDPAMITKKMFYEKGSLRAK